MSRAFFAALALALCAAAALSQTGWAAGSAPKDIREPAGGRPIVIGQSFLLHSKVLGDDRRVNLYLPDHYPDRDRSFPVLYLLDGGEHEDFHHITGLARITAAYGQGRELIVVGIEGVDRRRDLTSPSKTPSDLEAAPTSGGSAAYRAFLVDELKPWVGAHYRTDGHSAIMGESLAGLFVAETLLKAPTSFDDYIAISPSLWWNRGALSSGAGGDLKERDFSGRRVWIAFDDPDPPADAAERDRAYQDQLEAAFAKTRPSGLQWRIVRPGERHGAIYHPAALQALRYLYATAPPAAPPS
jgi:uncharacterized protein